MDISIIQKSPILHQLLRELMPEIREAIPEVAPCHSYDDTVAYSYERDSG